MEILVENMKKQVQCYQYISFDIFDTLLFRTVKSPESIFKLVEDGFSQCCNHKLKRFQEDRTKAEQVARSLNNHNEITMDQIYEQLPYDKEIKEILIKLEKEIEVENCIPNIPMIEVLKWCKSIGKTVIIITDMYLDRITIDSILSKIGANYNYIYISNEIGKTKLFGDLFTHVISDLGITADQLLHIGDNPVNDIKRAEEVGIEAVECIQYPYIDTHNIYKSIVEEHFECFQSRCEQSFCDFTVERKIGIRVFAPFIVEFCKWIHHKKELYGLETLLFVAREGFLIKKCYSILYPQDDSQYVCLNRNLLRLPMIKQGTISKQLLLGISGQPDYSWRELIQYMGNENVDYIAKILKSQNRDFTLEARISYSDIQEKKIDEQLNLIADLLQNEIEEQTKFLRQYLSQACTISRKIGLINNSINGTGQYLVERFLEKDGRHSDILGLQFIQSNTCVERLADRSVAWLTCDGDYRNFVHEFGEHSILFEHVLFQALGTAKKFIKNEDGSVGVLCEQQRMEIRNNTTINAIQEAVLRYTEWMSGNVKVDLGLRALKTYKKMIEYPDYEVADIICNLFDDDVEEDRKVADPSIPYKSSYLFAKNIPHTIKWVPGYLVLNNKGRIALIIYHYRMEIREMRTKLRRGGKEK
ncbi:HAD-IA family hydrolase [[Clostridium] fimetarium]|uniref:Haloacid dehalogenase superfamily, subfamily IA, variant 1 with third motif having Dx(3-4)D or Dx(3-4)E n=1 Tax=[Clostridium] fimetarium TaxID=99656 RepID=A0A1I0RPM0_9FIRM|nr:HAD-IA family hydrolase [[Clostridium] fimetarium]SEW42637.1 haloacid dehalogenase superfamily, subfamily IA, variant 1 with third motif having Dx(3-4)D or Dx(3-4)E [[Clostridium] fimetarium]